MSLLYVYLVVHVCDNTMMIAKRTKLLVSYIIFVAQEANFQHQACMYPYENQIIC